MSEKNNGGPAFPQPCAENGWASNNEYGQAGGGLSLRDYLAAKAMQSLITVYEGQDGVMDSIPRDAYAYADAMLAARDS